MIRVCLLLTFYHSALLGMGHKSTHKRPRARTHTHTSFSKQGARVSVGTCRLTLVPCLFRGTQACYERVGLMVCTEHGGSPRILSDACRDERNELCQPLETCMQVKVAMAAHESAQWDAILHFEQRCSGLPGRARP